MDRTDSRSAPSPEPASDDAASPFDSTVREDLLDFQPVPLRYRTGGLTPEKQREYVEALADCGVVREAAERIGITEQSINRIRRRSDARDFDRACEAAHMFGARRLRSIAFERAVEGTLKGHYYHGELVAQERVYDNRLLTYLLGKTENLLQPSSEARAVCDDWEACMNALEQGLAPPDPSARAEADELGELEVWRQDDGDWRTSFPPPAGFDGWEEGEWDGASWYCRALTAREQAAIEADLAAERAQACARRDRFFGFAEDGISALKEAEPSEHSELSGEPCPGAGSLQYKSLTPPRRTPAPRRPDTRPPSFRRKPESMNTAPRNRTRPCQWIPDRVRDDDPPSFRRKPESMNAAVPESQGPCPWIPDQVRDDESLPPSFRRKPESMNAGVPEPQGPCPRIPDRIRDDEEEGDDFPPPHIQTAPSRHPCY